MSRDKKFHFEARDVPPYAEPVTFEDLREGETYFSLTFCDEKLQVPALEPLVYVGLNLESGDTGRAYFQDVESYSRGVRYDNMSEDNPAMIMSGETVKHIFEYERALDRLLECSLRRRAIGTGRRA